MILILKGKSPKKYFRGFVNYRDQSDDFCTSRRRAAYSTRHQKVPSPNSYHASRPDAIRRQVSRAAFRRIATRYDKRADIFLSAVCIAAAITWWAN
jgi:hypothetical protein